MAWRDVDEAATAEVGLARGGAFFVETHGDDARTDGFEDGIGALVARVFDERFLAGIEQQTRREVEPLLDSGDDDDLLGRAANAARGVRVICDGFAQRDDSPGTRSRGDLAWSRNAGDGR